MTRPQRQTGLGPFHHLALRLLIAACWQLTFQFFGAFYVPIGLFDERELNFLPEAAAGEISTALALDRWRSDGELSAACGTVETAVSALTEPAPRQKDRLSLGIAQHDGISAKLWRV